MTIGATYTDSETWGHLQGVLDEVQLFNRALATEEVPSIFRAGYAGQLKPTVYDGSFVPPDLLVLDPGFDGRNAVVQWTAPLAGTYRINGRFEGIDTTTTDVAVLLNGDTHSPLISGQINGLKCNVPFGFVRTMAAGDRLLFKVNEERSVRSAAEVR